MPDLQAVRNNGNKEGRDIVWSWKCNRKKLYELWQVLRGIRSPILSKIFEIVICTGVGDCISLLLIYNDGNFQNTEG